MRISNKCSMALHILILLAAFVEKKLTSEQIAKSVGCNPVMVRSLLSKLKKAGLIETHPGVGGSVLAKDPKEIALWEIYQAVDPLSFDSFIGLHPNPRPNCPVGKNIYGLLESSYGKIRNSMRDTMEDITLQQLLDEYKAMESAQKLPIDS